MGAGGQLGIWGHLQWLYPPMLSQLNCTMDVYLVWAGSWDTQRSLIPGWKHLHLHIVFCTLDPSPPNTISCNRWRLSCLLYLICIFSLEGFFRGGIILKVVQETLGFAGCFFPEALTKSFAETSPHQGRTKQLFHTAQGQCCLQTGNDIGWHSE